MPSRRSSHGRLIRTAARMKVARVRQSKEYLERRRQQERIRSAEARAAHRQSHRLALTFEVEHAAFHHDPDINYSEQTDIIIGA